MGYFADGLLGVESVIIKVEEGGAAAAAGSLTSILGAILTPSEPGDGNGDVGLRLARSPSEEKDAKSGESYPFVDSSDVSRGTASSGMEAVRPFSKKLMVANMEIIKRNGEHIISAKYYQS